MTLRSTNAPPKKKSRNKVEKMPLYRDSYDEYYPLNRNKRRASFPDLHRQPHDHSQELWRSDQGVRADTMHSGAGLHQP